MQIGCICHRWNQGCLAICHQSREHDALACLQGLVFAPASCNYTFWNLQVMRELRPDAIALVDGFGFEDYLLNSAIGRHDGDVYTALLEAAKASTLNNTEEGPAWHDILKPVLSSRGPTTRAKL